jgi:hypothetical protein
MAGTALEEEEAGEASAEVTEVAAGMVHQSVAPPADTTRVEEVEVAVGVTIAVSDSGGLMAWHVMSCRAA